MESAHGSAILFNNGLLKTIASPWQIVDWSTTHIALSMFADGRNEDEIWTCLDYFVLGRESRWTCLGWLRDDWPPDWVLWSLRAFVIFEIECFEEWCCWLGYRQTREYGWKKWGLLIYLNGICFVYWGVEWLVLVWLLSMLDVWIHKYKLT